MPGAAADAAAAAGAPAAHHRHRDAAVGTEGRGRLDRVDDFLVTLTEADGTRRSFASNGDTPKRGDPRSAAAARDLLPTYTDKDIHDVTAYLVTLK